MLKNFVKKAPYKIKEKSCIAILSFDMLANVIDYVYILLCSIYCLYFEQHKIKMQWLKNDGLYN